MLPIVAAIIPEQWSSYFFPPLNDLYRMFAVTFGGLVTVLVYSLADSAFVRSRKKRPLVQGLVFILGILGAGTFLVSTTLFVRTIERPAISDTVTVSVGYERTQFARNTFRDDTDENMLRQRGPTEEEIRRLWTPRSIIVARLSLLLSYFLFLISVIGVCGLQVLYGLLGPPTAP